MNGLTSGCNVTDIVGDTVEYSCRSGYHLLGSNIRTCQTGGNWTGDAPNCEKGVILTFSESINYYFALDIHLDKSCSCPPTPTNGSRNCSGSNKVAAYSLLHYECNSGYHVIGDEYRTCHPSGKWTGGSPVCVKGI